MKKIELKYLLAGIGALSAILGLYFSALQLHIQLFKAESGLFLGFAFADGPTPMTSYIHNYILHSYNGHFSPLSFGLELLQSRIFNINETAWFLRQMLAVGTLWTAISLFVLTILNGRLQGRYLPYLYSLGLASIFVFQPIMIELIAWPFLVYQILSLTVATISMAALYRFAINQKIITLQISLGAAYLTMHLFGVGLAFSIAAIFSAAIISRLHKKLENQHLVKITFFIAIFITMLHGFLMTRGHAPLPPSVIGIDDVLIRFGYLFLNSIYMGFRALWGNGGLSWPGVNAVVLDSIYGWGTILIILIGIIIGWFRCRKSGKGRELLAMAIFLMACMLIYCALITIRSASIKDIARINAFLVGGRYVIFPSFFIFLSFSCITMEVYRLPPSFIAVGIFIISTTAIIGNLVFIKTVIPNTWPWMSVNHSLEWRLLVDGAREKVYKELLLDDIPLTKVDPELGQTLKGHRHLLEHSLGCQGCVKFLGD